MSLASNLAALARLLTAAASGIVNGTTPAAGDNTKALITSEWFKAEQATETVQGTAKVATQAQTTAGTDDASIVTPKKLRAGFSMSLSSSGWFAFPWWMGGFLLQWGTVRSDAAGVATGNLPLQFPTTQIIGFGTFVNGAGLAGSSTLTSLTVSSIAFALQSAPGSPINGGTVNFLALGK